MPGRACTPCRRRSPTRAAGNALGRGQITRRIRRRGVLELLVKAAYCVPTRRSDDASIAWRSGAAQRIPQPRGACAHLCRLAEYQSTPSALMSSARAPGTCAPSTSTGTPRAWHSSAIAATGKTSAVCAAMWSTTTSFVCGVERADNRVDDLRFAKGILDVRRAQGRARALADGAAASVDRSVRQIRDHHFVARRRRHRAEDGVHPRRDVGDEDEIVGTRADECATGVARFAQARHRSPRRRLHARSARAA